MHQIPTCLRRGIYPLDEIHRLRALEFDVVEKMHSVHYTFIEGLELLCRYSQHGAFTWTLNWQAG